MIKLPGCSKCGNIMEKNIVDFLSSWGEYDVELRNVPALQCPEDSEIIFELDVAEFIQELTILLEEMKSDITLLDMKNVFEELNSNEKRYNFLESYSKNKIEPLKSNEGVYYFNKINLKGLNRFVKKEMTLEEIKLAARDAKVSKKDQEIILEKLRGDLNDSESRNR